jgi:predicted DNA-binding transcriptional regulator YafY
MKAVRLLAILSRLQARGSATAQELAAEHEISVRTIYRDIDALSAAGFPVYGDAGPGGGFRLLDVATQRLTGLVAEEVEAMLLIGLPGPAAALGFGQAVAATRDKLMLRLADPAQAQAGKFGARFHLDVADWYRSADALAELPLLARAVLDEREVAFRYSSWTQERDWQVAPLGIVLKGGSWYLVGASRRGILTFRVAAMAELAVCEAGFVRPADFDLPRWWAAAQRDFEARLRPLRASLLLTEVGAARLAECGAYAAQAVAAGAMTAHGMAVELPFETLDQGARLLLSLGAEWRIVAPLELIDHTRRLAQALARNLPA